MICFILLNNGDGYSGIFGALIIEFAHAKPSNRLFKSRRRNRMSAQVLWDR